MRLAKTLLLLTIVFANFAFLAPLQEITIKTASHCDHFDVCETGKQRLEKQLMLTSGIKQVNIDSKTMLISVKYNPKRITPEKIRKVISQAGYDADDVKADPKGVEQLDECCKK
ncbi:MAG: heavy-metal-associated domain-containing protein [Bacteroidia bacterium]